MSRLYRAGQARQRSSPVEQPRFNPRYDESLWDELKETGLEEGLVYVTKRELWPEVERIVREHGFMAYPRGEPYQGRVVFEVSHPAATPFGTNAP